MVKQKRICLKLLTVADNFCIRGKFCSLKSVNIHIPNWVFGKFTLLFTWVLLELNMNCYFCSMSCLFSRYTLAAAAKANLRKATSNSGPVGYRPNNKLVSHLWLAQVQLSHLSLFLFFKFSGKWKHSSVVFKDAFTVFAPAKLSMVPFLRLCLKHWLRAICVFVIFFAHTRKKALLTCLIRQSVFPHPCYLQLSNWFKSDLERLFLLTRGVDTFNFILKYPFSSRLQCHCSIIVVLTGSTHAFAFPFFADQALFRKLSCRNSWTTSSTRTTNYFFQCDRNSSSSLPLKRVYELENDWFSTQRLLPTLAISWAGHYCNCTTMSILRKAG